ncbi:LamG-like jellyroll fold domain-containing protein [Kribbella sp. NPDC056345]|uniref:LamG-like jellyroll fold domain-containing protein n=1 Tax=Kribbella sp. NPDC056345 TaxID=3345789 RepID=UPI0035DA1F0A
MAALAVLTTNLHVLPAVAAPPPVPKVGRDADEAARFAVAGNAPVEVADRTTETSLTFANPDGSFTAEVSNGPVRVKRDGAWRAIDTTLEFRADGSVGPKAAASEISLSGGGAGRIGKMGVKEGTWTLNSPWTLPRPTLAGSTATYAEVLQGVDLVLDATSEGFSYNLVVKTREAATNPALKSIHFPVVTAGLSLRTNRPEGPAYVAADGRLVLTAGDAIMWDSAKSTPQGKIAVPRQSAQLVEEGPAGAHSAEMELRGDANGLTMVPNAALLTASSTVYPVVLDPETKPVGRQSWAAAWELYPTTSFFKTSHSLGVGYESYEQNKIVRSFFQYDTAQFRGKKITEAIMKTYETHSASCAERSVTVSRTTTITTRTTWNNQPGVQMEATRKTFAKGYSSACPDGYVEFAVTGAIADTAARGYGTATFRLSATNETDGLAWKQFKSDSILRVSYVTPPDVPRQLGLTDPATGCDTAAAPVNVGSFSLQFAVEPILQGRVNEPNARLYSDLEIFSSTGRLHWSRRLGPDLPGTVQKISIPNTEAANIFLEGATYHFRARTVYPIPGLETLYSGYRGSCYFRVDRKAPPPPDVTAKYGATVIDNCHMAPTCPETAPFGAGVSFTFKGNATDVVRHEYWFDGEPRRSVSGHTVTKVLIPPQGNRNMLTVLSYDPAGHVGRPAVFLINVQSASPPVSDWSFDDGAGTTAVDKAMPAHPLTVYGGGAFDDAGRDGKSIRFDGVDDYAETPTATVDTSKSFTVSAWARLWTPADAVVVGAAGNIASAFQLTYSAAAKQWVFQRMATDALNPVIVKVSSDEPAVLGAWTHLTGVYDSATDRMQLYVNGRLQTQGDVAISPDKAWKATGPISVGRGQYNDVFKNWFPGSIDRVQIWNRAMGEAAVMGLTNVQADSATVVSQAARWRLDGASQGADQVWRTEESVYGANMVMSGFGATGDQSTAFVEDDDRGRVLRFSGSAGEALSLPRPVVDAGTTFSVAVWVKLSDPSEPAVVARQAGGDRDAWRLEWDPGDDGFQGQWKFTRARADGAGEDPPAISKALHEVVSTEWQLLVATYDANLPGWANQDRLGRITLTVNNKPKAESDRDHTSPYRQGSTVVGKGRAAETEFAGLVDDLRMYVGPLTDSAVCREFPELGSESCSATAG